MPQLSPPSLLLAIAGVLCSPVAFAQSNTAAAESLFQEGKEHLAAAEYAEACSKFEQSQSLDPAVGALLGLGACREKQGKLSSAWAAFTDAQGLARRTNQEQRAQFAQAQVTRLEPRLSRLTLRVSRPLAATAGLSITLDGVPFQAGAVNTAMPSDGGLRRIIVSAPGKQSWAGQVEIPTEGGTIVVEVPELADLRPQPPPSSVEGKPLPPPLPTPLPLPPPTTDSRWTALQWGGLGAGGIGVVGAVVGTVMLSQAIGHNADSESDCNGGACGPDGAADRDLAFEAGKRATWFAVPSIALIGGGAALFIWGGKRDGVSPEVVVGPSSVRTRVCW